MWYFCIVSYWKIHLQVHKLGKPIALGSQIKGQSTSRDDQNAGLRLHGYQKGWFSHAFWFQKWRENRDTLRGGV